MAHRYNSPRQAAATPARRSAIQARHATQDSKIGVKYTCSAHAITYHAFENKPQCPMCDMENNLAEHKQGIREAMNKIELMHQELERLRAQVDITFAMREALGLTGKDDLLWLKTQLYQWKVDRSVSLKVTHGKRKTTRSKAPPNGFIAMFRGGRDPEGYLCTSIGGIALAEYYEEALNTVGSATAMQYLIRAMAKELPGATE